MIRSHVRPRLQLIHGRRFSPPREILPAYRPYTRAILRRYFRMAVDIGRLPSILGGLCFRARVSSYRLHTFEDAVIFVHDMERVFDRIERSAMEIIAGAVLLDYSLPEIARRLGITVQRAERRYAAALDALSTALLEVGLLRPVFAGGDDALSEPYLPLKPLPPDVKPSPIPQPFGPPLLSARSALLETRFRRKGAYPSARPPSERTISPCI